MTVIIPARTSGRDQPGGSGGVCHETVIRPRIGRHVSRRAWNLTPRPQEGNNVQSSQANATEYDIPVVEVQVVGDLCGPALPRFESSVTEALTVHPAVLIVDLARCPLIDAAGIGMLLDLHRQMRRRESRLSVREPSPAVQRLLSIARVDQILDFIPARLAEEGISADRGRS
jgi:anti-anti-sigma factor